MMFKIRRQKCIVIIPNCYNDEDLKYYTYLLNVNKCPVVELKCEQIFNKEIEKAKFMIQEEMRYICIIYVGDKKHMMI